MSAMLSDWTPLLAHVAGVPVEEVLPGVLAVGAVGARVATDWVRRRLGWRMGRKQTGIGGRSR
ncbi:MAG TPA: hypothetical protein VIZ91_08975 [Solirubrobacterales bacterium]